MLVIYEHTICSILHVKNTYVLSVSTWRLISCESCRYILLYTTLVGPRHRSEWSWLLPVFTRAEWSDTNWVKFSGLEKAIHYFIQDWVILDLSYEFLPFSKKTCTLRQEMLPCFRGCITVYMLDSHHADWRLHGYPVEYKCLWWARFNGDVIMFDVDVTTFVALFLKNLISFTLDLLIKIPSPKIAKKALFCYSENINRISH